MLVRTSSFSAGVNNRLVLVSFPSTYATHPNPTVILYMPTHKLGLPIGSVSPARQAEIYPSLSCPHFSLPRSVEK